MIRRWLWLPAIAVLVAGCSGGGSHSSAASTASAAATGTTAQTGPTPVPGHKPPAGWVRTDLEPVTQPEPAGGLLVLYVHAGGGLQVTALAPRTGRTVWHHVASPGDITPGVVPGLAVVGSTVVFLSPVDNSTGSARLVGVDAATGRQRWHTATGMFEDWPAPCPDNPADICTTGSLEQSQQTLSVGQSPQTMALRFRARDGAQAGAALISQSVGGRGLAPDLFDPGTRDPEMIMAVSGASVAWTRTLASVFGSGLSTDNGWNFDRIAAAGLFVGSVAGAPLSSTSSSQTIDLSRAMTAGFRISDGTAVWRDAGTEYACGASLPCPGGLRVAGEGLRYRPPTEGLRLRATGTATSTPGSVRLRLSRGADVVVEGFGLAAGKTLWSYDTGSDGSLLTTTPPLLGPYVVVLPARGGGRVALNLVTGAHSPVPAGAVGWCQSLITYKTPVGYPAANGQSAYLRVGQEAISPCRASGARAAAPRTVPGFVGTVAVGLTVWSESSEVVAAPTGS